MKTLFPHRGSPINPQNRFDALRVTEDPTTDWSPIEPEERPLPHTVFIRDLTSEILSENGSPDVGFSYGINPYRGCEHGCAYCYARPTHEYLGFSAGLDFETKIMVKLDAPRLLRRALEREKWVPQQIAMSGVTDCYQPAEYRFRLTRGCLEVLAEFRNPVSLITKNHLVTRDIDVLAELATHSCAWVFISITSLEDDLSRRLEPRASLPSRRLDAVAKLAAAGIPVSVNVAPVIPGLNDHEIPAILHTAAEAGAIDAHYSLVRFPHGVKDIFSEWLATHFPEKKESVLARVAAHRNGSLDAFRWHERLSGKGAQAEILGAAFEVWKHKAGLPRPHAELSAMGFRRPGEMKQLQLL